MFKIFVISFLLLANITKAENVTSVEIDADHLTIDQELREAKFTGNVVAKQNDVTIKSEQMVAYYSDNNVNKIDKIKAFGKVIVKKNDQIAKGDKAIYLVDKETIELYDNVSLLREKNIIKGDYLIYYLATGQSKITSNNKQSKQRVKAVFNPHDK